MSDVTLVGHPENNLFVSLKHRLQDHIIRNKMLTSLENTIAGAHGNWGLGVPVVILVDHPEHNLFSLRNVLYI